MGLQAVILVVDVLITTLCTLTAVRLRKIKADLAQLILIMFVVTTVSLIPVVGFLLSLAIFAYLLVTYTEASMAETVWIVLIAKMLSLAVALLLGDQWERWVDEAALPLFIP